MANGATALHRLAECVNCGDLLIGGEPAKCERAGLERWGLKRWRLICLGHRLCDALNRDRLRRMFHACDGSVRMRFFQWEMTNQRNPTMRTSSTARWKRWKTSLNRGSVFQVAPSFMPTQARA